MRPAGNLINQPEGVYFVCLEITVKIVVCFPVARSDVDVLLIPMFSSLRFLSSPEP
jgi:hypothetical protein